MTTARKAPDQQNLHIDGSNFVTEEQNELGFVSRYSCASLVAGNPRTANPFQLGFHYELAFPSDTEEDFVRQYFEFLLLRGIAKQYGVEDGSACVSPPETGTFYLVEVSSLHQSTQKARIQDLNRCINLNRNSDEECVGYRGIVKGVLLSEKVDTSELLSFIRAHINDGSVTAGTTMQASFLAAAFDDGEHDQPPDSINVSIQTQQQPRDGSFTFVGILLTVGLCVAFVALVTVFWRMRRRKQQLWREDVVMATRSVETERYGKQRHNQDNELPLDYGIDPVLDGEDLVSDGLPDLSSQQPQYTFDLGDNMKSELFGVHGGQTGSQRRAAGPRSDPDVSSDSDVDSWAQTDATLGSLEVRIGEITGEI